MGCVLIVFFNGDRNKKGRGIRKVKSGIYRIKNLANGKVYIGQSANLDKRMKRHLAALIAGDHSNQHIQSSFVKYGKDNFEFSVIEETYEDMLDIRECAWIRYYKSDQPEFGYNKEGGGSLNKVITLEARRKISAGLMGRPVSEETRKKMAESCKGYHPSKEVREKMSCSQKGRHHSEETKRKIAESHRGYNLSAESHRHISEAQMGRIHSAETRQKMSERKKGKPWSEARRIKANKLKENNQ